MAYDNSSFNQKRAFPDLVSLDAWHYEFNEDTREADVRIDVSFDTARLGREQNSRVQFEVQLRRARLQVDLPPSHHAPVHLMYGTSSLRKSTRTTQTENKKRGRVAGSSSVKNTSAAMNADAELEKTTSTNHGSETLEEINSTICKPGFTNESAWWNFYNLNDELLDGFPWKSDGSGKITVVDHRASLVRSSEIENQLHHPIEVFVECRREDLEITIKPDTLVQAILDKIPIGVSDRRLAAAESYLRDVLVSRCLPFDGDLRESDRLAKIQLAWCLAVPQPRDISSK